MKQLFYVEEHLLQHPRVLAITDRYPKAHIIPCEHYGEIFNKKNQNFRLQKQAPAFILAEKTGKKILSTPESFGIGGVQNYYFSHMLNCLYDCRYCFLQGMYRSANYVFFINYEDFQQDIQSLCESQPNETFYFFSGYDGDSLVLEPFTRFIESFVPFFDTLSNAYLELRTKSVQIRALEKLAPNPRCIVAWSFTPQIVSSEFEAGVPSVEKRIEAMKKLADQGWQLGLRFDPLIYFEGYEKHYEQLFADIFSAIPTSNIHSVSMGPLRFPKKMYDQIKGLYPESKLFVQGLEKRQGQYSYGEEREKAMKAFIKKTLLRYIDDSLIFECYVF